MPRKSSAMLQKIFMSLLCFAIAGTGISVFAGYTMKEDGMQLLEARLTKTGMASAPRIAELIFASAPASELARTALELSSMPDISGVRIVRGDTVLADVGTTDISDPEWIAKRGCYDRLLAVSIPLSASSSNESLQTETRLQMYGNEAPITRKAIAFTKRSLFYVLFMLPFLWMILRRVFKSDLEATDGVSSAIYKHNEPADRTEESSQLEIDRLFAHTASARQDASENEVTAAQVPTTDDRLSRIADTLSGGAIFQLIFNQDGSRSFTYLTDGFAEIFGIPAQSVLKDASTLYHRMLPDDLQRHKKREEESIALGEPFNSEVQMQSLKSGLRWIQFRAKPAVTAEGQPCLDGLLLDMTLQKQVEDQLREMATTDGLTGLVNRRYFMQQADKERLRAVRDETWFSIMMVDADHFKRVNDTYGHDTGDVVLVALANALKDYSRNVDVPARLGGEEFAILLPQTHCQAAVAAAERVREQIEALTITADESMLQITVSIGVATMSSKDESVSEVLKKADEALYRAKATGRNRVVSACTADKQAT